MFDGRKSFPVAEKKIFNSRKIELDGAIFEPTVNYRIRPVTSYRDAHLVVCIVAYKIQIVIEFIVVFLSQMVHCCVPECTNHSSKTETVSYHKIPNDQALQKAWIGRIKRENLPNLKNCYVCSDHFESTCFEVNLMEQLTGMKRKRRLKKNAVPSVFTFSNPPAKRRATTENRLKCKQDEEVSLF